MTYICQAWINVKLDVVVNHGKGVTKVSPPKVDITNYGRTRVQEHTQQRKSGDDKDTLTQNPTVVSYRCGHLKKLRKELFVQMKLEKIH